MTHEELLALPVGAAVALTFADVRLCCAGHKVSKPCKLVEYTGGPDPDSWYVRFRTLDGRDFFVGPHNVERATELPG